MESTKLNWAFIALLIITMTGCSVSPERAQSYLDNGNYKALNDFVISEFENNSASINPNLLEPPTAFEIAIFGLLSNENPHQASTTELLNQNFNQIGNRDKFGQKLWNYIVANQASIPIGLHSFLLDNVDIATNIHRPKIEEYFNTDSNFRSIVRARFNESLKDEKTLRESLPKVHQQSAWVGLDEITSKTTPIISLRTKLEKQQEEFKEVSEVLYTPYGSNSTNQAKEKLEELKVIVDESYIFYGYMVALNDNDFAGRHVYEVHNIENRDVLLLITDETKFSSQGFFQMRVVDTIDLPTRLKTEYGGFERTVTVIMEVPDSMVEEYNKLNKEYRESRRKITEQRLELFTQSKQLEKEIGKLTTQLNQLINELLTQGSK